MKKFPIVCVGGSVGGLDAFIRLLENIRADMGVAIVSHITLFTTLKILECATGTQTDILWK